MTALLGLLAVAGFQNRDKIAELLGGGSSSGGNPQGGGAPPGGGFLQGGGSQQGGGFLQGGGSQQSGGFTGGGGFSGASQGASQPGGLGGIFGNLAGSLAGAGAGGFLSGGLGELVDRFKQSGHGAAAESWVSSGPNQDVAPPQIEQAIGPDVLATLSQQTGLSREELLARLSRELPGAVDRYTPDGRLPS
jgi:uncharacterized protein YidB (DUF937 family)